MSTLKQRFWNKVEMIPFHECWEWNAFKDKRGYGHIGSGGRGSKVILAHRLSYELVYGVIPNNLFVCHRCDNPGCVRPDHLFLGTHADNVKDMCLKNRQTKGETHGNHKLTEDQVMKIKDRNDCSQQELAQKFNVNQSQISRVLAGETWKHMKKNF